MSISMRQNEAARLQKSLADLRNKLAGESKKEASIAAEIGRIERSITGTTSYSSLQSKQQQITRKMSALADIQKKKADISKKIADTNSRLYKTQEALTKEEENERKKIYAAEKKREREQLRHQRAITQELRTQHLYKPHEVITPIRTVEYDVFISYASEDKDDFVKPLAEAIKAAGYKVWFDEFALKVGDSLRRSIDNGLTNSRFGVVVLSKSFFAKNWTQYELDGLVTREMEGQKVILPIWHMVSMDQVLEYSPSLADKKAINSSLSTIDEIVIQLSEVF